MTHESNPELGIADQKLSLKFDSTNLTSTFNTWQWHQQWGRYRIPTVPMWMLKVFQKINRYLHKIPHTYFEIFLSMEKVKNPDPQGRVADPVHFRPDPDPANWNFKNRIRILLPLTKNQFKHQLFSHQSDFFWYLNDDYFFLKKGKKFTWKCVKKALF